MNKKIFKTLATVSVLSCLFLSLTACVTGGSGTSGGDVNNRMANLEDRVNTLSAQIDGTQSAQVWSRMQQMESDLSIVRNQMNDLDSRMSGPKGNQVMSANDRLDRMEAALKEISARLGIKLESLENYTPAPQTSPEQNYGAYAAPAPAVQDPSQQAGTTQVVNSDGTVTVLINGVPQRVPVNPDASPSESGPAPVASPATQVSAGNDVAQTLYDRGLDFFNKYQYNDALTCFKDFTDNYPNHPLTGNAWFWQGECSYQLQDYPAAVVAYQKVITAFSDNNKYVSSLLKQGMALDANGNREQAKVRWQEVRNRFPNTPEATRAKQLLAGKG